MSSSGSGVHLKNFKTYPSKSEIRYMAPYAHYHFKGELMLASNGSSWAKKGEKKHYVGKSMKYQGAPKRGPNWAERMMSDRRKDIIRNIENFILNGGN